MEQVKLLRLKTGEDVISYIEDYEEGKSILRTPMVVMVKYDNRTGKQNVLMDHWLPITVILENEAVIDNSEILTSMNPSAEFSEYYESTVGAIANAMDKGPTDNMDLEQDLTPEELTNLMDSMEPGSKYIH